MLERFTKSKSSLLDDPIAHVLAEMGDHEPGSPEHMKLIIALERLTELKYKEPQHRVSPDTMLMVGGNLFGILILVGYEHAHVIGSKAINLLLKPHQK